MVTSRKLRAFKNWMKWQGLECSDALDLVVTTNSSAVSVRALCDLDDGDLVASIPKESCLTVKTSGARQMIEEAELEGILALAVAIMYERNLGRLSPWFGYLQLLPYSEPIPLLWSLSEIDSLLVGTELHKVPEPLPRLYEVLCRGAFSKNLSHHYDHLNHLLLSFFKEFYFWNRLVYHASGVSQTLSFKDLSLEHLQLNYKIGSANTSGN